jgi:hypothetical protein
MSENWLRFVRDSLRVLLLVVRAYFSIQDNASRTVA